MKTRANTAPQSASALEADGLSLPDLLNKTIEPGLFRSRKGSMLLLYLADVSTGETQTILWDDAPSRLKAFARRLALDPLGLIARYDVAVKQPGNHRPPASNARTA